MYGIIDVGNWQDLMEMGSGRSLEMPEDAFPELRRLAATSRYPGDDTDDSIDWMKDCVDKVQGIYNPDLLILAYTQPFFNELYKPENAAAAANRQKRIIEQIKALAEQYDYLPLIVMTSGYVPLKEEIYQPATEGILESWAWGAAIAGFSGAVAEDRAVLEAHPHITKVITLDDVEKLHPQLCENFRHYFADYIVAAAEGYGFRGYNCHAPKCYMVDIWEEQIPVYCALEEQPRHIKDIFGIIKTALLQGKRIMPVVIEGYDKRRIPEGFTLIDNVEDWYAYRGLDFYMNILTGKSYYENEYPPVCDRTKPKRSEVKFPFGGFFEAIPECTLTDFAQKSAVVSSRSMVTQMAANADVAVECFSRDREQMGVLVSFKPEKFGGGKHD